MEGLDWKKPSENLHLLFTFQGFFDHCNRNVESDAHQVGGGGPKPQGSAFQKSGGHIITSSYRMTLDQQKHIFFLGSFRDWGILFFVLFVFSTLNFQHDILVKCGYSGACSKNQIFATSGIKKQFDAFSPPKWLANLRNVQSFYDILIRSWLVHDGINPYNNWVGFHPLYF